MGPNPSLVTWFFLINALGGNEPGYEPMRHKYLVVVLNLQLMSSHTRSLKLFPFQGYVSS